MACCSLSRKKVLNLYINTPHWRRLLLLRLLVAKIALVTLGALGVLVYHNWIHHDVSNNLWGWGNLWLACLLFVPSTLSLLTACITNTHLLLTTRSIPPILDLLLDLLLTLATAFPIAFCVSVPGPLQWWEQRSRDAFLGAWELVAVVGLCLLCMLHSGMFLWACRRMRERRRAREVVTMKLKALSLVGGEGSEIEIGRGWDLSLPSAEVRNQSRCEGVVVPEVVVEESRAERRPESPLKEGGGRPGSPLKGEVVEVEVVERRSEDSTKKAEVDLVEVEEAEEEEEEEEAEEAEADPELPRPLKVQKSVAKPLFKAGNSWEIKDPPTDQELDQGW